MRMNRHENTETGQQGHAGGSTETDQWQRHADHRQDTAHHADIDEDIDEECQDDAPGQQRPKVSCAVPASHSPRQTISR